MKLFVWDLHGTLEKGNEIAALDISNRALAAHGYKKRFTEEDGARLYGLKWHEYYADLLPDVGHKEHTALHDTSLQIAEADKSWSKHVRPTRHIDGVLSQVGAAHRQVLLSNTLPEHLQFYVKHLNLSQYFMPDDILSVLKAAGDTTTKIQVLTGYLHGKQFEGIVVIGDRAGDMEVARAVDGTGYLYAHPGWKFHESDADHKIRDLREVLREL